MGYMRELEKKRSLLSIKIYGGNQLMRKDYIVTDENLRTTEVNDKIIARSA